MRSPTVSSTFCEPMRPGHDEVSSDPPVLDIVVPVFNEGVNILRVLTSLEQFVQSSFRVLICYDDDDDDTIPAVASRRSSASRVSLIKNQGKGVLDAVKTGLAATTASAVLIIPADDDYNAGRIEAMMTKLHEGCDVVCASRFMPGGQVSDFPWLKAVLVRSSSFMLHHFGRLPTRDATNGLRLFSRRVVKRIPIHSTHGHAYSIELLVKAHRLGWRIAEVPAEWSNRNGQGSRFRVFRWMPSYLRWFCYVFATTYLRRGPATVRLRAC